MKFSHLSTRDVEARAKEVENQIKKLAHHPRPTPREQELSAELKRVRLSLKDQLARREL